ncbi:MAG: preprotein translocase subunit SecG [Bacteroidales bacterium]|nr:preprotein translocase subunit SecG [Bacteroidales bacterium]MBR0239678.1 preprotein translocase subunit SecG [Bacteroidales bacterium]MBR0298627.1 preprotein translocase subunit SecG [Bacteroidales bacterium]
MSGLFVTLIVFVLIACVLLIGVVLLQNGKGDGFASNFIAGNQAFGVRQTADILEKVTWGLVTFILVVAIVSSFTLGNKGGRGDITDKASITAPAAMPEMPAPAPVDVENPEN